MKRELKNFVCVVLIFIVVISLVTEYLDLTQKISNVIVCLLILIFFILKDTKRYILIFTTKKFSVHNFLNFIINSYYQFIIYFALIFLGIYNVWILIILILVESIYTSVNQFTISKSELNIIRYENVVIIDFFKFIMLELLIISFVITATVVYIAVFIVIALYIIMLANAIIKTLFYMQDKEI